MKIKDAEISFNVKFRYRWNGYDAYDDVVLIEDFPADYINENKLLFVSNAMKNNAFFLEEFNEVNNTNLTLDSDIMELKDLVRHIEYICDIDGDGYNKLDFIVHTANGVIDNDAGFDGIIKDENVLIYTVTDVRL